MEGTSVLFPSPYIYRVEIQHFRCLRNPEGWLPMTLRFSLPVDPLNTIKRQVSPDSLSRSHRQLLDLVLYGVKRMHFHVLNSSLHNEISLQQPLLLFLFIHINSHSWLSSFLLLGEPHVLLTICAMHYVSETLPLLSTNDPTPDHSCTQLDSLS